MGKNSNRCIAGQRTVPRLRSQVWFRNYFTIGALDQPGPRSAIPSDMIDERAVPSNLLWEREKNDTNSEGSDRGHVSINFSSATTD